MYGLAEDDSVLLADASAAASALVISLPDPHTCRGRQYSIKKIDTTSTPVHIESTDSQLENGVVDLITPLESVVIISDGTQWWVTAGA